MVIRVPLPIPPVRQIDTEATSAEQRGAPTPPFLLWERAIDVMYAQWVAAGGVIGGTVRETLTAGRTYFVANPPLGNNLNNGLTVGLPFADAQKAIDVASGTLDMRTFPVTIQFADDVNPYPTPLVFKSYLGAGPINLIGNPGTPANVILETANAPVIQAIQGPQQYFINGFTLRSLGAGQNSIIASLLSRLSYTNIRFGQANQHIQAKFGSQLVAQGPTTILNEPFNIHWYCDTHGTISDAGVLTTIIGNPPMGQAFAFAIQYGLIVVNPGSLSPRFIGAISTGQKFSQDQNAFIFTGGSGVAYLPGGFPGTVGGFVGYN